MLKQEKIPEAYLLDTFKRPSVQENNLFFTVIFDDCSFTDAAKMDLMYKENKLGYNCAQSWP